MSKRVEVLNKAQVDAIAERIDEGQRVGIHDLRCLAYTARQLRLERRELARMALPEHPRGGFFNPLQAFAVEDLAKMVLDDWSRLSRDDRIAQLEARIYQLNRFVSAGRRAYNGKDFRILGEAIEVLNDQNRTIAAGTSDGVRLVRSARAPEEGIHG